MTVRMSKSLLYKMWMNLTNKSSGKDGKHSEYKLYDSICSKLKTRQNKSMILAVMIFEEKTRQKYGDGNRRGFRKSGCLSLFRLLQQTTID